MDLIEVGDIVEIAEDIDNFNETNIFAILDIEIFNNIKIGLELGEIKLLSILTHERYENNCYKLVFGDKSAMEYADNPIC